MFPQRPNAHRNGGSALAADWPARKSGNAPRNRSRAGQRPYMNASMREESAVLHDV